MPEIGQLTKQGRFVTSRLRSRGLQRLPLLAGWLFADLFLVLFLVGLASSQPPKPHHTVTPTPTPTPTSPRVLDRHPVSFWVNVPPAEFQDPATRHAAKSQLLAMLNRKLHEPNLRGQQAGFLLVFAPGPLTGINQAVATAKSVVAIVRAKIPAFSEVSGVGYWGGSTGNSLKFTIFFFARPT